MKVSIATTLKEGLMVGMRFMPSYPYDGPTLAQTLEQVGILTGTDRPPATAIVDRGHRGVKLEGVRILMSGQKRGITRTLRAMIKRRSAIESAIGHMKMTFSICKVTLAFDSHAHDRQPSWRHRRTAGPGRRFDVALSSTTKPRVLGRRIATSKSEWPARRSR